MIRMNWPTKILYQNQNMTLIENLSENESLPQSIFLHFQRFVSKNLLISLAKMFRNCIQGLH